jgi:hypothetical protein
MTVKRAKRRCRNCGKQFRPARNRQFYCQDLCTRAARRIRDREARQGIRAPRDPWTNQGPNRIRHVNGRCIQCKRHKELRFDSYGSAQDDMLDVQPEYCTVKCLLAWWSQQANGPTPDDVDHGILRLIRKKNGIPDDDDDGLPDWDEEDEDYWDDEYGEDDDDDQDDQDDLVVIGARRHYK